MRVHHVREQRNVITVMVQQLHKFDMRKPKHQNKMTEHGRFVRNLNTHPAKFLPALVSSQILLVVACGSCWHFSSSMKLIEAIMFVMLLVWIDYSIERSYESLRLLQRFQDWIQHVTPQNCIFIALCVWLSGVLTTCRVPNIICFKYLITW